MSKNVLVESMSHGEHGYLSIWPILDRGKAGGDNVLILPEVSLTEPLVFVDFLSGRQNTISNAHFTVREGTGVTDVFVCNNNNDCEDVELGSCSSYTCFWV